MADVVGAGKFLTQELNQYDTTFYSTVYPEYWGAEGKYHPTQGNLELGTKNIVSGRIDYVGEAAIYDGKSTDIPLSDFGITEDEYKARIVIAGAQWNIFDLAAAQKANRQALLPNRDYLSLKMEAMKRSMDRRIHRLVWAGEANNDMEGLFSGSQVTLKNITTDLYALTSDQLYDFFLDELSDFQEDSLLTAEATWMYVPKRLKTRLTKRFPNNMDGTPYLLLTDPKRGIMVKGIQEVNELKSSFLEQFGVHAVGTNKDRLMFGQLDDLSVLKRQFYPMDRSIPQLADDGVTYRITAWCATTEMQFREPFRVRYLDIPRAT